MPRVAIDFSNTVIYHFVCKDTNVKSEYVGSTTNFNKRKGAHKVNCFCETTRHHYKLYQTIRENGGWDNWDMLPLEEFSCKNRTQQLIREQYWLDRLKPDMNSYLAYREGTTIKEKMKAYREANADKLKEKYKAYREANAEILKEKMKSYREANAEILKEKKKAYYEAKTEMLKEKKMAYREANAEILKENTEVINEKMKAYREANADKLKEKRSIKHTCECGSVCALYRKAIHERTQKHKDFMIS